MVEIRDSGTVRERAKQFEAATPKIDEPVRLRHDKPAAFWFARIEQGLVWLWNLILSLASNLVLFGKWCVRNWQLVGIALICIVTTLVLVRFIEFGKHIGYAGHCITPIFTPSFWGPIFRNIFSGHLKETWNVQFGSIKLCEQLDPWHRPIITS